MYVKPEDIEIQILILPMSVGAIKLITVWSNYYDPIKFATEKRRENEFYVFVLWIRNIFV